MTSPDRRFVPTLALAICAAACAPDATTDEPAGAEAGAAAAAGSSHDGAVTALANPKEYLRVHNVVASRDAADDDWRAGIEALAADGDAFTLEHFARIDRADLSEWQIPLLDDAVARITARVSQTNATYTPELIVSRLERAAFADLMCDRLENTLPAWTFADLGAHLDDPAVRAEVERLAGGYTPTFAAETLFSSMEARVPKYARQVLEAEGQASDSY